jgi:hypothetical protein
MRGLDPRIHPSSHESCISDGLPSWRGLIAGMAQSPQFLLGLLGGYKQKVRQRFEAMALRQVGQYRGMFLSARENFRGGRRDDLSLYH